MQQYNGIKRKYPDALLLFRVGDFYETFGSDAVKASKILDIVLTKRSNGAASEMELAGFPYHSLDTYLPKLVRSGLRVAICEQVEDPKEAKGIVKRDVTELVTPGLTLDDNVLDRGSNNFLSCVHFGKSEIGVAFLDISTGEFFVTEGDKAMVANLVENLHPSEILYQRKHRAKFVELLGEDVNSFSMEDWVFTSEFGTDILNNTFGTNNLKGFGIEKMDLAVIAAGGCLQYLVDTRHQDLSHINGVSRLDQSDHVWIDGFTARSLEILRPLQNDGLSLYQVLDRTCTAGGSRLMARWVSMPLNDQKGVKQRQELVSELMSDSELQRELLIEFKQVADLERLSAKIATGRIRPRELLQLAQTCLRVDRIGNLIKSSSHKNLSKQVDRLASMQDLGNRILTTIVEDPPVLLQKGNVIRSGVSEQLDDFRDLATTGKDRLLAIQEREMELTGINKLKVGFNNVFGYYLEVGHANKDKVPETWQRKQTLVNAERYITPELKELEEKILKAEDGQGELEAQIYHQLIQDLGSELNVMCANAQILASLDCLLSFSVLSEENQWVKPEFNNDGRVEIIAGRHPIIEATMPVGESYIPNDVTVDRRTQQILMITGPNMSGKSALLRQTALICIMAQIGCYVPAKHADLQPIDKIFSRVGASDNISSGESTFMVEMNETASILHNMTSNSLIILDEIGRGTSTYDGISIAMAIVEFIHDKSEHRPNVLFATHYHELNEMESHYPRVKNFHVSVKEVGKKVIFLRKLEPGGTEHSFGIHVAKMAGIPSVVVRKAYEILERLETGHNRTSEKKSIKQTKDGLQLSFFQLDDPVLEQVREEILNIDIDTLTPVEALMKLNSIKKLLRGK